jgi:hypothetical protein
MKNENEIKDLLDRLRGEIRTAPGSVPVPPATGHSSVPGPEKSRGPVPFSLPSRQGSYAPSRAEFPRAERGYVPVSANIVWSENKEAMLFGVLASLAAALGGVLAGVDYLILAGTASFMLFSFVMVLTLFGYYLNFRRSGQVDGAVAVRLDQFSRRLESLEGENLSGRTNATVVGAHAGGKELEQKVEELRKIVKSLVKAVEGGEG